MRLSGDEGARGLLAALDRGAVAEIAAASDVSFDVDTPDDLAKAQPVKKKSERPDLAD
jgi:CTP:molybdopterin cytidylyltransferase MocA